MQEQNNDEDSDVPKDRVVVRIPYLNKMKGMLRRIFLFAEPTIILHYNLKITHEMSFFGPIINNGIIVDQSLTNIYNDTNCYDKDVAEDVECEEVKVEPDTHYEPSTTCLQLPCRDYSKSPLFPLLTHPEHAPILISWLHSNMSNQSNDRDRIKPLKAAFEYHYFKSTIPYETFKLEFGKLVCQSSYSKLMGQGGNYTEDELKTILKSLNL